MDVIRFPVNLKTTSGLSILMHGVISPPDVMSYDKQDSTICRKNTHFNCQIKMVSTDVF